jgi:starch phosphorylase
MKAAMNGVLNLSIADGWWPEGCIHGETGWQIGHPAPPDLEEAELDVRDRLALYEVLFEEVVPLYYNDRNRWIAMMEKSVAMAQWRFSAARMVEDYFRELYA